MDILLFIFGALIIASLSGTVVWAWTKKCKEVYNDDRSIVRPVVMWGIITFFVCIVSPIIPAIIGFFVGLLLAISIDNWYDWRADTLKIFAVGIMACIIVTIASMLIFATLPYTEEKVLTQKIDIVSVRTSMGESSHPFYIYQYSDGYSGIKSDSIYDSGIKVFTNSNRSEIDFLEQRKVRDMSACRIIFPLNDGIWVESSEIIIYTPQATV